jgi:hypothetical protein
MKNIVVADGADGIGFTFVQELDTAVSSYGKTCEIRIAIYNRYL